MSLEEVAVSASLLGLEHRGSSLSIAPGDQLHPDALEGPENDFANKFQVIPRSDTLHAELSQDVADHDLLFHEGELLAWKEGEELEQSEMILARCFRLIWKFKWNEISVII